ncbi:MAG: hypothetical protein HKN12_01675, partial [Gemmatimonadetes bacterium]|nr:hypothetical protein [Gemmatimonadota bacterium]
SLGLFVTGEVSLWGAADGDMIEVQLDPGAVTFSDPTATAASWPLASGAVHTVNGLVADQVTNTGAPVVTIGPGETALAMDIVVPPNGYRSDVLEGIVLTNLGTAADPDLAEIRLWRDGGDGTFDGVAGGSDDLDLGPMTAQPGQWNSPLLGAPVSAGGARIFVSVTADVAATDSTTVRLGIPTGGLVLTSNNDGPIDASVENANSILISTAALLVTMEIEPLASTVGDSATARMTVRNSGSNLIQGITPSTLDLTGAGQLTVTGAAGPASLDLLPGQEGVFVWPLRADSAGVVQLAGSATGTEIPTMQLRQSLQSPSNVHEIFQQANDLDLFAVESMPATVSRGQTDVVPMSLSLTNPGSNASSDIRVEEIRFRIDDGAGNPVVPADVIKRVTVNEGSEVFLDKTAIETTGDEVVLALVPPLGQSVLIESSAGSAGQATLSLSLEIADSTVVPAFRVLVPDSTAIRAEDAISGAPVNVRLQAGTYPVASGLARVVSAPTQLDVSGTTGLDTFVVQGQSDVTLLDLEFLNPDPAGLAADIRISSFDVGLVDSTGVPIHDPDRFLKNIRLESPLTTYLDRPLGAQDDSTLSLVLSQLISLPNESPLSLSLVGEIADSASLEMFRVQVGDSASFDARDASAGNPVPVVYATDPLQGGRIQVMKVAQQARVRGTGLLPAGVTVGDRDVAALSVQLIHPGPAGVGAIRCDSLTVRLRDERDNPLVPGTFLDGATAYLGGAPVGVNTSPPASGDLMTVPLSGVSVSAGQSASLELRLDVEASAPASFLEVVLEGPGIHLVDAQVGTPVSAVADSGVSFPLESNLA